MHLDYVDNDYHIQIPSPYRSMNIAGVLLVYKMYGKHNNRTLYKCIPYNKQLPVFLVPYEEKKGFSKKKK